MTHDSKQHPTDTTPLHFADHAAYDHCTSRFLAQAGVEHDFVRLEERGIHGNSHMMMCELNNHDIADLLLAWLGDHLPGR